MKRYTVSYDNGMEFSFLNKTKVLNYLKEQGLNIKYNNANGKIFDSNENPVGYFTIQNLKDYLCLGGEMNGKMCDSVTVKNYDYIMFNSGIGNTTKHSAIFVHKSLL